jgi:DNA-binding NarL/FixJ family response regulator
MSNPYLKLRLVIADDHEMVREGLQLLLKKISSLEVVGEASNGEELVAVTRTLKPDVLLIDVKMPKCNGTEATKVIKEEFPHIGIVALSSFDEEHLIMDMLNAGAKGYLLKNAGADEILAAVQAAYKDEAYYSKEINLKLAQMVSHSGLLDNNKKKPRLFNDTELEIITMVCDGFSSKQIANVLHLKARTIERYRDAIMEKMDVKNAAGVVMYAIKNDLYKGTGQKNQL